MSLKKELVYLQVWPLSSQLSTEDREEFLKHFGAQDVQHIKRRGKSVSALAGFQSLYDAQFAIARLHQIKILGIRLNVAFWEKSKSASEIISKCEKETEEEYVAQLQRLSCLSEQLGHSQLLPSHVQYKYPEPNPTVIANIANTLVAVPKFYTQVLHLMNKMNLPCPFGEALPMTSIAGKVSLAKMEDKNIGVDRNLFGDDCANAKANVKDLVCKLCRNVIKDSRRKCERKRIDTDNNVRNLSSPSSSSEESELESDGGEHRKSSLSVEQMQLPKRKRYGPSLLPIDSKRAKLQILQQEKLLQLTKNTAVPKYSERSLLLEFVSAEKSIFSNKIQVNIPTNFGEVLSNRHTETAAAEMSTQAMVENVAMPDKQQEISGFGKIDAPQRISSDESLNKGNNSFSLSEIDSNKIKESEFPVIPVLANYKAGQPSCRLYVKNLAKNIGVEHLRRLYDRFADQYYSHQEEMGCDKPLDIMSDSSKYHIKVMQSGRMKGQAFVTLPSVALAEEARLLTNGFILMDKPMVVCFARGKTSD